MAICAMIKRTTNLALQGGEEVRDPPKSYKSHREMTPMRVLVTGASSVLGATLADELIRSGHEVHAVGEGPFRGKEKPASYAQVEVQDLHHVDTKLDRIYHLALSSDALHPVETALKNSLGTLNLLRVANVKRARMLLVTDSEFMQGYTIPWDGGAAIVETSFLFAEGLCAAYAEEKGVDARIARVCDVYGPGYGKIAEVVKAIARGEEVRLINSDVYPVELEDAVKALIALMESAGEGLKGRPIDICGERTDLESVAKLAKRLLNSPSKIYSEKKIKRVYRPDPSLASDLLGWSPKWDLGAGIAAVARGEGESR